MQCWGLKCTYLCGRMKHNLPIGKAESLEDFYQHKFNERPLNINRDVDHFNVFRLEDCLLKPVTYSRRDFYKISLMRGRNRYHYAERSIYADVRASQSAHQNDINGNQPNDPEKGVAAIIQISESEAPPLHLFLGQDAYELAAEKTALIEKNMAGWKEVASETAF